MAVRTGVRRCNCEACERVRRMLTSKLTDPTTGDVLWECWCGRDETPVSKAEIREVLTRSCGRTGCDPEETT